MLQRPALFALFAVATIAVAGNAQAQVRRTFPATALRGALVVVDPPQITLNGDPARLAPGARIRDASNMIKVSGGLIGARLLVNYTVDANHLVSDVWILSPEEAAKRPWPTTIEQAHDWVFDPVAQTWSRP